ncbi:hypothetical protein J6590_058117, partial [Homalodisca vitripennis]
MDLLDLKSSVAESLLKQGKNTEKKRERPSADQIDMQHNLKKKRGPAKPIPEPTTRRDETSHWPQITEDQQ